MAGTTLQSLQNLYSFLNENYDDMRAKCTTGAQIGQLNNDLEAARSAFHRARNLVFQEDDPPVTSLNNQLTSLQGQIADMTTRLQDIVKLLGLVTSAVSLAGRLSALGLAS